MLEKNAATPLYQQIVDYIREKIRTGEYKPGEIMPSESAFCEEFGVSRITVRNAIQILVDEGLVTKHHGKGSFVTDWADRKTHEVYYGLGDLCGQRNIPVYSHILSVHQMRATQEVQKELKLGAGTEVVCVERVSLANSIPAALERLYLPAAKFSYLMAENLENRDLRKVFMRGIGHNEDEYCVRHYFLTLAKASDQEAAVLGLQSGDPLFVIHSTPILSDGEPLCFSLQYLPGSLYSFTVTTQKCELNLPFGR